MKMCVATTRASYLYILVLGESGLPIKTRINVYARMRRMRKLRDANCDLSRCQLVCHPSDSEIAHAIMTANEHERIIMINTV
jgi:hypothetical protein